jgi:hypothetical protein
MAVLFKNNASSRLAVAIAVGATSLSVTAGEGAKFPSPTAGDWFPLTLIKASGAMEILQCTARSGDVLTITRAQEGTSAQAFSAGDRVELRLTEGAIAAIRGEIATAQAGADAAVKKAGDTMTGQLIAPSLFSRLWIGVGGPVGRGFLSFYSPTNTGSDGTFGARIALFDGVAGESGKASLAITAAAGMTIDGTFGAASAVSAYSGRMVLSDGFLNIKAFDATSNIGNTYLNSDGSLRGQLYTKAGGVLAYNIGAVERFRVQNDGIVSIGAVFAGNGAASLGSDGGVSGPAWGGSLGAYLATNYLQIANFGAVSAAQGIGAIGSYAMLVIGGGGGIQPGATVAGGNAFYAAASYVGNVYGTPPGMWRIMGAVANADGSGSDSITICQRIS